MKPRIAMADPRPLLTEGQYLALCTRATYDWSRRWRKWIVILTLEPTDYTGAAYTGTLCKFLGLGKNPIRPKAHPTGDFYKLYQQVNGAPPVTMELEDLSIFENCKYMIAVTTVKTDSKEQPTAPELWYSKVGEIQFLGRQATNPIRRPTTRTVGLATAGPACHSRG